MRIVAALGGNALHRHAEPAEARLQQARVAEAASALAVLAGEHELVITHGNGASLALELDVASASLDILGAESQGRLGYLLVQALAAEVDSGVAALLTQVVVADDDPAFQAPAKPIGPVYGRAVARRVAVERGWTFAADGQHLRRVVPSPEPREIVELPSIRLLLEAGALVVCAGGGGVPVIRAGVGLRGVEAVIEGDLTAALLAEELGADLLLLLTDVPYVERRWGAPDAEPIRLARPCELRALTFASGSMAPKIEAACRFVERTGARAAIGSLADLEAVADGLAGTQIGPYARREPVPTTRGIWENPEAFPVVVRDDLLEWKSS